MADSPLSITSSVISILTFVVAILIWLGQHLDRAMKLDDEIATTALMLIRSCGETADIQSLTLTSSDEQPIFSEHLAEMWSFDLQSITAVLRILREPAAKRILHWDKEREMIRDNSKEVKRLRFSVNTIKLFVLPRQVLPSFVCQGRILIVAQSYWSSQTGFNWPLRRH
jgi:hypothetical protein